MPELPEVETLRRDLEARVIGRTIVSCEVSEDAPRLVQFVTRAEFCRQLTGRRITGLRRRGKYLIIDLDDGRAWVVHRGMSGNVLYRREEAPEDPWVRAVFVLDDAGGGRAHELRWADLRKFGKRRATRGGTRRWCGVRPRGRAVLPVRNADTEAGHRRIKCWSAWAASKAGVAMPDITRHEVEVPR